MKKIFTLIAAAAMTLSASAEVIYSWSSTEGTVEEVGGKATAYVDEARVNYENTAKGTKYYTICLCGKDATYPESAYVTVTLDKALEAGDTISITAYRNKNATGKEVTAVIRFNENLGSVATTEQFPNINADAGDEEANAPGTQTLIVPAEAAGCTSITMSRGSAGTNLFITKLEITREGGNDTPAVEGTPIEMTLEDFSKYGKDDRFTTFKGVYNFDEATGVYTFPNFLGGKEAFSFTLEADSASENLHIVPQAGVTVVNEDVWGRKLDNFTFNGLKDSYTEWSTYDGKDYVRLYDPKSYGWDYTYAFKEQKALVENPNPMNPADFRFYYKLSFNIVSKYGTPELELSENPGNFNLVMEIDYEYKGSSSAIQSIATDAVNENAPVEYFNLQGIRINDPAAGQIVIRRQGSKVSKVIVR